MAIVLNLHDKMEASCVFADDHGDAISMTGTPVWQGDPLALVITPAEDGKTAEIEAMMPGWTKVTIKGAVPDGVLIDGNSTADTYMATLDLIIIEADVVQSHATQAVFTVRDGVEMTRQVRPV